MKIYRIRSQRNPDAFLPHLAGSLNNLGDRLSELGQREEALEPYTEALDMIWPSFERFPHVFKERTVFMIKGLLRTYEALQHPIPPVLQERMMEFMRLAGLEQ